MNPTENGIDLSLLDPILLKYNGRSALLSLLHEAQAIYGWLPRTVQETISRTLHVPLAEIHGVIEFYTMFYNQPTAKRVVRICDGMACDLNGSAAVMATIEETLGLQHGETSADGTITYERVPCLGMCEHGPNALNGEETVGMLTPDTVGDFLEGVYPEPRSMVYGKPLLALERIGLVNPYSLTDYEVKGGYRGLRKALTMTPESLIEVYKGGEILGRGGAMFPFGLKIEFVRGANGRSDQKHIVVNADESEPGTFKDRTIMEEDPFSLIEAATIIAYAAGVENGWILVRGEYPRSYKRLSRAIEKARAAGYLGRNIMGHEGFHFDIEMRLGAGAYICGEETALFEAIEGKRGFPRIKPPYPPTSGLFNQPTLINNVETLVMSLASFNVGLEEWAKLGTEKSPGTKLFCLSGHIKKPGTYELPFGITIRELLEMAGGIPNGKSLKAILLGGAAGSFIGLDLLDMPLTYEDARANNVSLGSGALMVFDETADLRHTLHQLAHFFAHESCGKCFPCQIGTQRQLELMDGLVNGRFQPSDKQILLDVGFTMTETSLCGLGQTAAMAITSAVEKWPELLS
ncbi:MAG: NADH-quinone oxidoreductase subunit E [Chloroflexi bacterium]|nr:NADH-quinone oxidoreductase subunit E [Chloroflexota bacterium]